MALAALDALIKDHEASLTQLYTSLGIPDVVSGKIQELHTALIATVNKQRVDAETELTTVKSELKSLKEELKALSKELGVNLSPDLPSESLVITLENRRKALTALHDLKKDRTRLFLQVYQQLALFAPILDLSFFDPSLEIPFSFDLEADTLHNLTLLRHRQLSSEVTRCQQEVNARRSLLLSHLEELGLLYADLALDPPASILPLLDNAQIIPSAANLELVAKSLQALDSERVARESQIQVMYDQLYSLWLKLDVPESYSEEFIEIHAGISDACIQAYQAELERMQAIKRENMSVWVSKEREEVNRLKEILYLSPSGFSMHAEEEDAECYTDEYLQELEREKLSLEQDFTRKEPILKVLVKYMTLLQEMKDLEASANDPTRLTGKGVRGDPGRLLREEKLRKRIAKEKPKLEMELLQMIPLWETEHGQLFLVDGSRFIDDLQEQMALANAEKQIKRTVAKSKAAASINRSQHAGTLKAQATGSSISSNSLSQSSSKRPFPISRPASPNKRSKANPSILAPGAINRNPLPKNWGQADSGDSVKASMRKSFKPRPSMVALSMNLSSYNSQNRAVSTQSSAYNV